MPGTSTKILINRAPVLTLWAAVVAERLGYGRDAALTFGRVVAGRMAARKAESLGLMRRRKRDRAGRPQDRRDREITLMGSTFGVVKFGRGMAALSQGKPIDAASVREYLEARFGEDLAATRRAMASLARSRTPKELQKEAYRLYESFRPIVPRAARGWGAKGVLDLERIRGLVSRP